MKFLTKVGDVLLGRTRPARPNLDVLFAIPAAAIALRVGLDLAATGSGGVCFRTAEGGAGARTEADALALSRVDPAGRAEIARDEYAYTWVTFRRADADLSALVTDLHAVNTTLAEAGFGSGLLCTLVGFSSAEGNRRVGLVYLFKRGTVYPFAPIGGERRDNELELAVRAQLTGELPLEEDLSRWFPLWSAPPLT